MIDFDIGQKSVLLLGNYRTGSTSFSNYLCEKYNLELYHNYAEAFHTAIDEPLDANWFNEHRFLVKVMPDRPIPDFIDQINVFKILMLRKDWIAQLASFIISNQNKWKAVEKDYDINIDIDEINQNIKYLGGLEETHRQRIADVTLYFEDIINQLPNSNRNTRPMNYQNLIDTIKGLQ